MENTDEDRLWAYMTTDEGIVLGIWVEVAHYDDDPLENNIFYQYLREIR